jgi:oligopeptidase B
MQPSEASSPPNSTRLAASMLALAAPALGACQSAARPTPPVAKQVPFTVRSPHGDRTDEYYWLRDDDAEKKRDDVMEYLRAEQAYTEAMMAPIKPLEDRLLGEIRARIKEDDSTPPQHDHGHWYWTAFKPGAEYACWMRRKGGVGGMDPAAADEVMLDGVELAQGHDFFRVSDVEVSPDGTLVAWTQDTVGRRGHDLRVKDLRTGQVVDDAVKGALEAVVWANDGKSLFYIRQDPVLLQSGPVCRHVLGTPAAADTVVYEEPDDTLFTSIAASASRKWLTIEIEGYDTTELRAVSLDAPTGAPVVVLPRTPDVRCYSDHFDGAWIIRTNADARDFRIVRAPEAAPADRVAWKDIVPHRAGTSVDGFAILAGGLAVAERSDANARVRIVPWSGGQGAAIPVAEAAHDDRRRSRDRRAAGAEDHARARLRRVALRDRARVGAQS